MPKGPSILFAGGGSGGHIFPSIAIAQRVAKIQADAGIHFLVSNRAIDATVMGNLPYDWSPSPAQPLPRQPMKVFGFIRSWKKARAQARLLDPSKKNKGGLMSRFCVHPSTGIVQSRNRQHQL